jgi:hypothetical protein
MAAGKFAVVDPVVESLKIYTLWSGLIGGMVPDARRAGHRQFFVQRLLAARSRADAAWGVFASGLVVFAQFALFLLIGVMLWVFYQQTPLPVRSIAPTRSSRLRPPQPRARPRRPDHRGHRRRGAVAVDQRARRHHRQRLLSSLHPAGRRRRAPLPRVDGSPRSAGARAGRRGAGRRAHGAERPGRRPHRAGPVVGRGAGAFQTRYAAGRRSAAAR